MHGYMRKSYMKWQLPKTCQNHRLSY